MIQKLSKEHRPAYSIERAAERHIPLLREVELAAAESFPPGYLPEEMRRQTIPPDDFQRALKNESLWVAVYDGRPVGFALLQALDASLALLAEVDVRPEHQNRGLGRALIARAVQWARSRGRALYLTTFEELPWNAGLYQSLGFGRVPEEQAPEALREIIAGERAAGLSGRIIMAHQDFNLNG